MDIAHQVEPRQLDRTAAMERLGEGQLMGSPASFWAEAMPWAQQVKAALPMLYTSLVLAQWAIETGYGGWDWSVAHNPGNVGSYDGQPVNTFPSLQAGVTAYIATMRLGYYAGVRATTSSPEAQAVALGQSPWASGRYALPGGAPGSELIWVIDNYNLKQYDGAPPAPAPRPSPPPAARGGEMIVTDDQPGGTGFWGIDANGGTGNYNGAPFIPGLNTHPEWHAGSAESGGTQPVVGAATFRDANGNRGIVFQTALNGQLGDLTKYSYYRIARSGAADVRFDPSTGAERTPEEQQAILDAHARETAKIEGQPAGG